MKAGSLVKYIGGQDIIGRKKFPLSKSAIYTVKSLTSGKFSDGVKSAISLEECKKYVFVISMFKEIQSKDEIDIELLLKEILCNTK